MEQYREVKIAETRYRIGRLDARVGSWILLQLLTKSLPMGMSAQIEGLPATGGLGMSQDEFFNIQTHCLAVCSYFPSENADAQALPIVDAQGRITVPGLQQNIMAMMALTLNALIFNMADFFKGGGLKALVDSLPAQSQ